MKQLFMVKYQIEDRGIAYPQTLEEISIDKGKTLEQVLRKKLNTYRHAMDLTKNFTIEIISYYQTGWSKN